MISNRFPALWSRLASLPGEVDRFLEGQQATANQAASPPVNVWEAEDAYHVEVELPGVAQDKVEVTVTHGTDLLIEAQRPMPADKGAWLHQERGCGRFRRLLHLPLPVQSDQVEAKLEHGVLCLRLPKAESVRPRRIAVKGE